MHKMGVGTTHKLHQISIIKETDIFFSEINCICVFWKQQLMAGSNEIIINKKDAGISMSPLWLDLRKKEV